MRGLSANLRASVADLLAERDALKRFDDVVQEALKQTPEDLPPLEQFIATEAWQAIATAARTALAILAD